MKNSNIGDKMEEENTQKLESPSSIIWRVYEKEKRIIANKANSVEEYDRMLKELVEKMGL